MTFRFVKRNTFEVMQRKFLSNLILVLILNLLVKPFYILGVDAEFLKRIEAAHPGEYGEYFSIVGLTFIFNIFLDLGLSNFNTREVARAKDHQSSFFSSILTLKFLLIFIYFALIFGAGTLLNYSDHQYYLLTFLGVNQVLVAFILFFRSNLAGMMRFKEDSVVGVLDRALLVVMCSLVLWGGLGVGHLSIELFVWLQTGSYVVTLIVVLILVLRQGNLPVFKVKWPEISGLLRKALPYAFLVLLMTIYYRTDSVMIEYLLPTGKREAAIYAQGFRFLEAFTMIGYLFAGLLLPIFSKMLASKQDVSKITMLSFKLIFSMSFVLAVGMFFNAQGVIEGRFQTEGMELIRSAASLQMLMVCFVAMISTYIFGTLLTANGSLRTLNGIALSGVVLNLILNYFWIKEYGAFGAALASMITQVITALLQMAYAVKVLKIKASISDVIRLGVFALLVVCIGYFLPIDQWFWNLVVCLTLGAGIAILTGVFSFKEAISILKNREQEA